MNRVLSSLLLFCLAAAPLSAQTRPPQPAEHGAYPTVSPDGNWIAFLSDRSGTDDIYVMRVDGSGLRRVTTDGGHQGRSFWTADGSHLLYGESAHDSLTVFSLAVLGGAPTKVARFAARTDNAVRLLDGTHFLYGVGSWTETQLVTSRADGSGLARLTADHAAYWCFALSPRGDRVAAGRRDSLGMQVWVMNVDGSRARAVTRFTRDQGTPQCPQFSPDGRRLAVQSDATAPRDSTRRLAHVWVVDLATGRARQLARHAAAYLDEVPVWFPDGTRIAFQSDRTGRWEVWIMNADGTGARQLTR